MKKILLSLMIAGAGLAVKGQETGVKFGVKAGVTFPTLSYSSDLEEGVKNKANTSFYVGGTVDIPVGGMFSIQPGLTFSGKGDKQEASVNEGGDSFSLKASTRLMYIELPVNAVVSFPVGEGKVFVGAGPYYGMAISGQSKRESKMTVDGITVSEDNSSDADFGKDGDTKRGDFGLNFLAGYQLGNGFNIHAGYGLGLSNISKNSGDFKVKNNVFSVGVGFSF
ncbi:hypothetical protein D3C87_245150 [compost metagenome]